MGPRKWKWCCYQNNTKTMNSGRGNTSFSNSSEHPQGVTMIMFISLHYKTSWRQCSCESSKICNSDATRCKVLCPIFNSGWTDKNVFHKPAVIWVITVNQNISNTLQSHIHWLKGRTDKRKHTDTFISVAFRGLNYSLIPWLSKATVPDIGWEVRRLQDHKADTLRQTHHWLSHNQRQCKVNEPARFWTVGAPGAPHTLQTNSQWVQT